MTNLELIFYRVALVVTIIYIFIVLHIGKEKLKNERIPSKNKKGKEE